jgi:hypothetical protein
MGPSLEMAMIQSNLHSMAARTKANGTTRDLITLTLVDGFVDDVGGNVKNSRFWRWRIGPDCGLKLSRSCIPSSPFVPETFHFSDIYFPSRVYSSDGPFDSALKTPSLVGMECSKLHGRFY